MIRVEIDETIKRPIDDVFEQLADIERYPKWMPDDGLFITCMKDSEGPVRAGTAYTDRTRFGAVRGEVNAFERPNRIVFHYTLRIFGAKVMEGWPGYELKPGGPTATAVHHVGEAQLYGPFKLLSPVIRIMAQRERQRTVDALKASLESERD